MRGLIDCGLTYKSGYWRSGDDSLEDIIVWNRQQLERNFSLGYTEHYSGGYKQMLFDWEGFSEVRLFINNEAEDDFFSFSLIVPESDLMSCGDDESVSEQKKIEQLQELALGMWSRENLSCIQTRWECSFGAREPGEIERGKAPSTEPFSIIPAGVYKESWGYAVGKTERKGLLLRKKDRNTA